MYGISPPTFTACCKIAFLGALGPGGTGGSSFIGLVTMGGEPGGVCCAACTAAEENLAEMLDSHEFLLDTPGGGVVDFGMLAPSVIVFSVDGFLEKLDL